MADLSWRDGSAKVLEGEQEPIHYTAIAPKIVDQQLRTTVGATPANTVGAPLSTSLRFAEKRRACCFDRSGFYSKGLGAPKAAE